MMWKRQRSYGAAGKRRFSRKACPERMRRNWSHAKFAKNEFTTKGTKVFVGCASRTGQSRNISRKGAKDAKEERIFHHEEHEVRKRSISTKGLARLRRN